jgi:hypothetical protein
MKEAVHRKPANQRMARQRTGSGFGGLVYSAPVTLSVLPTHHSLPMATTSSRAHGCWTGMMSVVQGSNPGVGVPISPQRMTSVKMFLSGTINWRPRLGH